MDFLVDDVFLRGIVVSLAIAVPVGAAVLALGGRLRPGVPVGGAVAVGASMAALRGAEVLDVPIVAGTLLAAAGGLLGTARGLAPAWRCLLVAPGVLLAVTAAADASAWMVACAAVGVVLTGPAADAVDRRYRRTGLGVAMLCVTTAGVFVTIPETGAVLAVLGAMVPLGLLAVPRALVSLGPGGGTAMLTLLAVLTLDGGWTRPGAIVGGLAAAGLLALLVVVPPPPPAAVAGSWTPLARRYLVLHGGLVIALTRFAGLLESAWAAAAAAAVFAVLGWLAARRTVGRVAGAASGGP